jgi:hypothetical protein
VLAFGGADDERGGLALGFDGAIGIGAGPGEVCDDVHGGDGAVCRDALDAFERRLPEAGEARRDGW